MEHTTLFRVRHSEIDQRGTFYGTRAFEWFECGRAELLPAAGLSNSEMERRGAFLPVAGKPIRPPGWQFNLFTDAGRIP